jgi:hypothetical protein
VLDLETSSNRDSSFHPSSFILYPFLAAVEAFVVAWIFDAAKILLAPEPEGFDRPD